METLEDLRYASVELEGTFLAAAKKAVTILIVTAANTENNAVIEALNSSKDYKLPFLLDANREPRTGRITGNPTFYVSKIGDFLVAHMHLSYQGADATPHELHDAMQCFPSIKLVIMPGMAFGLHSHEFIYDAEDVGDGIPLEQKGQKIGDILVDDSIIDTTLRRADPEMNRELRQIVQHLKIASGSYVPQSSENVFFGPFLCVREVVRNQKIRQSLRKKYGLLKSGNINALGGDMETSALKNFIQYWTFNPGRVQVYPIIVKAICDWGFNKPAFDHPDRPLHETERRLASRNSFAFVIHILLHHDPTKWIEGVHKYSESDLGWTPPGTTILRQEERGASTGEVLDWFQFRNKDVWDWANQFAESVLLRGLVITGPGGRGKTFFAKQLRLALAQRHKESGSRHVWFDCATQRPDSKTLIEHLECLTKPFVLFEADHCASE